MMVVTVLGELREHSTVGHLQLCTVERRSWFYYIYDSSGRLVGAQGCSGDSDPLSLTVHALRQPFDQRLDVSALRAASDTRCDSWGRKKEVESAIIGATVAGKMKLGEAQT